MAVEVMVVTSGPYIHANAATSRIPMRAHWPNESCTKREEAEVGKISVTKWWVPHQLPPAPPPPPHKHTDTLLVPE